MQSTLDLMRRFPNVWVETSGMMGMDEVEAFVREVGAGRLLHGSCMILQMPAEVGPLRVRSARIGDEEKEMILGGNAQKLFGLGSPSPAKA